MIRFLSRYHCSGCNFVYCKFVSYIDIAEFHGVVNYQRKIIEKFTATLDFPDSCTNVYNNKSEYRIKTAHSSDIFLPKKYGQRNSERYCV